LPVRAVRLLPLLGPLLLTVALPAHAQEARSGRLHVIWDGESARGDAMEFVVVEADGRATRLDPDARLLPELLRLDRRLVRVELAPAAERLPAGRPSLPLRGVRSVHVLDADGAAAGAVGAAAYNPYNFVTVLCRFADDPSTPFSVEQAATVHGPTYPGMRQYYRELAGDASLMSGSGVVGWIDLPYPRSVYVQEYSMQWGLIAQDCAGAVQHLVDFRAFHGINVQVNGALNRRPAPPYDEVSYGGSWTLTLNGEWRTWGVTWLSGSHWNNYVVVAHEIGHALGWPHSSGMYGQEYDSHWDVMSRGYLRSESPWGWLTIHTIAQHKDAAGWIPAGRRLEPARGTVLGGPLARSALPPPGGYLIARVPFGYHDSYTVETRQRAGHDWPLPGESVLIHEVRGTRAYVVDSDNDGNPNDHGAQWYPGEVFIDAEHGVVVSVDSAGADAFHVTVANGWRLDVAVTGMGAVAATWQGGEALCRVDCKLALTEPQTVVTLQAVPQEGMAFEGWSGECAGTDTCSVTARGFNSAGARFEERFAIATHTLAPAVMGAPYEAALVAEPVPEDAHWSVAAGALPAGLALDAATGVVAGIPELAGAFSFVVALSAGALRAERTVGLAVGKPTLSVTAVLDQLLGADTLGADQLRFLDLLGNRNGRLDVGDVRAWLLDTGRGAGIGEAERDALLQTLGELR
jgi:M6 family metalloprotease-like protein